MRYDIWKVYLNEDYFRSPLVDEYQPLAGRIPHNLYTPELGLSRKQSIADVANYTCSQQTILLLGLK